MCDQSLRDKLAIIVLLGISLGIFIGAVVSPVSKVEAQQAPFLISPYYGSETINSYFDHRYPTYSNPPNNSYPEVVIYTGASSSSCSPYCYDGHDGYDFSLVYERVLAAASGEVIQAGWQYPSDRYRSYGLRVEIRHANGYITRYGHLSTIAVSVGQQVTAGQVIGTSGNTGNSTGPHLHFGVMEPIYARAVDPFGWSGGYGDPWAQYQSGATSWCVWADGQWANICGRVARPIPAPADGTTIIVDDQGAGFSKSCAAGPPCPYWYEASAGYNNHMWWIYDNDNVENYWARWNPAIPQQGIYEVWVHIPNVNATTWQARYTITHYDGQNTAIVDQYGLNNQWVSIGVYRFHEGSGDSVRITDATGEVGVVRKVGVDAVKFVRRAPAYLPDVKINYSGWDSTIVVRSNGGNAFVEVKFYDQNGGFLATRTNPDLAGQGIWTVPLPPLNDFAGSAVIDASQDVAVVVEENQAGYSSYAYNGIAAADSLNPGWGQVGTAIHLPLLMDGNSGWSTSVTILNAGSGTANFDFDYFSQISGVPYQGPQGSLEPNESVTYLQVGSFCPTVGAGYITSTQPLAVIVKEWSSSNVNMVYNGFSDGATTVSLPLIMANNYGWYTGIAVQNLGSAATNITVNYYPSLPEYPTRSPETVNNVQPYATAIFGQSGGQWGSTRWVGSARVTASQPIAAIVNETTNGKASSYSGFTNGSSFVVLPDVRTNYGGWTSGVQVQNLDSASAHVVVRASGSETWLWIVECTNYRRIAAIVNTTCSCPGDLMMTYNGINR